MVEFCFKLMALGCKMFSWSLWSSLLEVWGWVDAAEKEDLGFLSSKIVKPSLGFFTGVHFLDGDNFTLNGELVLDRKGEVVLDLAGDEGRLLGLRGDKALLGEDIINEWIPTTNDN